MSTSRTVRNTIIAAAAVVGLTLATVAPASATNYTRTCGSISFSIGVVTSGAWADDRYNGDCGTVAVRARYNLPNGVTTYTNWVTHSNFASVYIPSNATLVSADVRAGGYYYYGLKK